MGRIIKTESTGKQRNQLMRTGAELLRHLSQKNALDDEARDMVALLIYCLREIEAGIEQSVVAWEKRDYWIKAENFRERWRWVKLRREDLEAMVINDEWQQLPEILLKLLPHFSDIKITKFTRSKSLWRGAYKRLMNDGTIST